jgi:hypothetical protein
MRPQHNNSAKAHTQQSSSSSREALPSALTDYVSSSAGIARRNCCTVPLAQDADDGTTSYQWWSKPLAEMPTLKLTMARPAATSNCLTAWRQRDQPQQR